jgi:phage shock protein E
MKKIFCSIFILCFVVSYAQGEIQKDVVIDGNSKIIDVRTEKEYKLGHLKNAINIPYTEIKEKIKEYVRDKEEKIILYCRSGRRAGIAEKILKEMGYKNVINAGAYEKLKKKEEEKEKQK